MSVLVYAKSKMKGVTHAAHSAGAVVSVCGKAIATTTPDKIDQTHGFCKQCRTWLNSRRRTSELPLFAGVS